MRATFALQRLLAQEVLAAEAYNAPKVEQSLMPLWAKNLGRA